MKINLVAGHNEEIVDNSELVNENGIEVSYGFDGRVAYGYVEDSFYSGIDKSGGLHKISLSRELEDGEEIKLIWKNGYEMTMKKENGAIKFLKPSGGCYDEGAITFDHDVTKKEFGNIEIKVRKEIL